MSLIDFRLFAHLQWVFFFVSCESPLCSSCVLCSRGDCIFCLSTPVLMSFLSFRLPTARPVACTYTWERLGLLVSEDEFSFKDLDESNLPCHPSPPNDWQRIFLLPFTKRRVLQNILLEAGVSSPMSPNTSLRPPLLALHDFKTSNSWDHTLGPVPGISSSHSFGLDFSPPFWHPGNFSRLPFVFLKLPPAIFV